MISANGRISTGTCEKQLLARKQTPGCQTGKIHFNNAGCGLPPKIVTDTVIQWVQEEALQGGYETARKNSQKLFNGKSSLAKLLNCSADEIGIVNSATRAWQQVFFGSFPHTIRRIFTSQTEYGSNYINFLQLQKRHDTEILIIPEIEDTGVFDSEWLQKKLNCSGGVGDLIAVSHMPTSSGKIVDAEQLGRVVKEYSECVYLLDACQTVGQIPIDVQTIGCHFLTGTSRKYLRGPRGVGFVYASQQILDQGFEPACLDIHSAQWNSQQTYKLVKSGRRFEEFELNMAAVAGFGVAVEYALDLGMQWLSEAIIINANYLRQQLYNLKNVVVYDQGGQLGGIVSFNLKNISAESVMNQLNQMGTNVSVSSINSSRFDFEKKGIDKAVRASVHYYNTFEEIDTFIEQLQNLKLIETT